MHGFAMQHAASTLHNAPAGELLLKTLRRVFGRETLRRASPQNYRRLRTAELTHGTCQKAITRGIGNPVTCLDRVHDLTLPEGMR
jgi:hypothetical protein